MSIQNVISGKKSADSITSQTQIPYQNFEFLKSNTWATRGVGSPKTVDMGKYGGQLFESNSNTMRDRIKKSQVRKQMTERQIRYNNQDSFISHGGGGGSMHQKHGKRHTQDYQKLKEGFQDMTPTLTDTDKQLLLIGLIALVLFLRS